ncbi:MAG: tetratricopeptide repeat protein [Betaproteobacteria bacterium]
MSRCRPIRLAAVVCFVLSGSLAQADELLDRAKQFLDAKDPQAAYQLLAPVQTERAGDPSFDYLLGVAALDAGRNTEAVFALERVLAVQPDNAEARAEIARAYFNLKETQAAKREFENVKGQNPPAQVSALIDRYLDAIDRAAVGPKPTARFFVEGFAGYDSNVNSATADRSVAVPLFGGALFSLAPNSSKQDDGYWGFAAGFSARMPVNPRWALIAGFSGSRRWNFEQDLFDTSFVDLNFGATYKRDRDLLTFITQLNDFTVYDPVYKSAYREARGGTLQWQRDLDARNQVSAYFQYAGLAYPDQRVRDADRYVAGLGIGHAYRNGGPVVYASLYGGREKPRDSAVPELGYDLYGVRVGGEQVLKEKFIAFASGSYERRNYDGQDPFFLIARRDDQWTGTVGMHYVPARNWRLTTQLLGFRNDSNITLNTFDRVLAEFRVRRDFDF